MSFVTVKNHYLNTDAIQYATRMEGREIVTVHFLNGTLQMSVEEWQSVLKAAGRNAAKEPDGVHAKLDILTKLMNPEEES